MEWDTNAVRNEDTGCPGLGGSGTLGNAGLRGLTRTNTVQRHASRLDAVMRAPIGALCSICFAQWARERAEQDARSRGGGDPWLGADWRQISAAHHISCGRGAARQGEWEVWTADGPKSRSDLSRGQDRLAFMNSDRD